jgi:hypothetical protein
MVNRKRHSFGGDGSPGTAPPANARRWRACCRGSLARWLGDRGRALMPLGVVVICRAAEFKPENAHAPLHAVDECVLKEVEHHAWSVALLRMSTAMAAGVTDSAMGNW